ncbi:MAG TPA: helix-turn-helix transcriptional regulator [Caulobacteraceae bacterium]|jgi:transcriptional regulator with XRE-family HTH domain|nr:helix-turn-helix transcriptional regulator [Caulobacteraceae bacterium]
MRNLKIRFGKRVARLRTDRKLTQEKLAEAASLSIDTVSKIETGALGARFGTIENLANALDVEPEALFASGVPAGANPRKALVNLTSLLVDLSDEELTWLKGIVEAALRSRPR